MKYLEDCKRNEFCFIKRKGIDLEMVIGMNKGWIKDDIKCDYEIRIYINMLLLCIFFNYSLKNWIVWCVLNFVFVCR